MQTVSHTANTVRTGAGPGRARTSIGPAVLSVGFRPFFLLAAAWAVVAVPLWLLLFGGGAALPTAFDPVLWHGHEMLFGFVQAAVAGFLLTAIPNWTGRLPLQGWRLALLALLFVAGRLAVTCSQELGAVAAVIDVAFPAVLFVAVAREIVAGRNWRNAPVLAAIALFGTANGLTHLDALGLAATGPLGLRLGVATIIAMIGLVGGRIIPSFTRNWLVKRESAALPVPFGRVDVAVMATTVAALAAWVFASGSAAVGPLLAIAAVLNFVRLARWQGHRTGAEPLVWVLHLGYLWVPVGIALLAAAALTGAIPESSGLHALTSGAMATMVLAISTRATLGHTGRTLHAGPATMLIYVLATVAAVVRVGAGFWTEHYLSALTVAGFAWTGAFGLFLLVYGAMLLTPRPMAAACDQAPSAP